MFKKVLVPVDGSALAEAVLPYAESLTQLTQAEIVLLRVSLNPVVEFSYNYPVDSMLIEMDEQAKTYVKELAARLEVSGQKVSVLTREGPVAETILTVAAEVGADLIAMSTHGRSGVQRWLLGSTADRVVNHSCLPVLLIRPN